MKLLLVAPEGLEVQGFKGAKHAHRLNLAVIAALATPYFKEIKNELFRNNWKGTVSDIIQAVRGCPLGCE